MRFAASASWAGRLVLVVGAVLPFAVWPGLAHAFSTPKLWTLVVGVSAVLALTGLTRSTTLVRRVPPVVLWALFAHAASFAIAGLLAPVPPALGDLLLGLAAPAWALAVVLASPSLEALAMMFVLTSLGESVVVLLQWAGRDPYQAMGWWPHISGASDRLATYGTLGNPNFVAAWLSMHVPVALAVSLAVPPGGSAWKSRVGDVRRALSATAAVAAILSVLATGSRAGVMATAAGVLCFAMLIRRRIAIAVVAASVMCVVGLAASPARPLDRTLAGRLYIWHVVAPQTMAHPLTGWGVGSIDVLYREWETRVLRSAGMSTEAMEFIGPQQHAHGDVLEALVERGASALVALVLACAAWWTCVRRSNRGTHSLIGSGFAAGLVAFGTAGLFDFPAARPAEAVVAFTSLACLALAAEVRLSQAHQATAAVPANGPTDGRCAPPD